MIDKTTIYVKATITPIVVVLAIIFPTIVMNTKAVRYKITLFRLSLSLVIVQSRSAIIINIALNLVPATSRLHPIPYILCSFSP